MSLKVVIFNVNDTELEEQGVDFENELHWLKESNIQYQEINEIPLELSHLEPIETIWIMKQIRSTLDYLVEYKQLESYTEELIVQMTKEFHNNLESIDQDMDWKVRNYLGIEE
ncbi:hypothetical protein [Gottfriedia solisilvae]|uniref:hypothetical protein n=1 Tax=Gottfriedia solisilvae TaxID=1516104 RepID=UPI003D2EBC04